jgi:hypothetical protein
MAFRAEVGMTVFQKNVLFAFSGSDQGFMGEITFPDKFHIGDAMKGVWKVMAGNLDAYPFGDIDIEVKKITALMKEDKAKQQSFVMWSVLVGGLQITVYFINDQITKKQIKVFCIESNGGIEIDGLPGVNAKLPDPITANPILYLASDKASFIIGNKEINVSKGFTAEATLDIPKLLTAELSTISGINIKFASDKGKVQPPSDNPARRQMAAEEAAEKAKNAPVKQTKAEKKAAKKAELGIAASPVKWKKIDKKLGKFATIHRVGFLYKDKQLSLHFDMDAQMSVVQVGLINLQLKLDTTKFALFKDFGKAKNKFSVVKDFLKEAISFGLDGLGIAIETSSLTIAGILYIDTITINKKENGKIVPKKYKQYVGALVIKTKAFSAAGIAAYGKIDGYKSFFFYVFVGAPIGGPPYFFVNGLALGFGYNRQVKIPDIDQVADFPFVRIAMGNPDPDVSIMSTLTKMVPIIVDTFPPQEGSLFFAVGVKFNSMKLLDGFVLLMVSIGKKVRIDVLGLLMLVMPKSKPVAIIELAIKVTVIPEDGIISVEARITNNSYIFSKKAKLQGGFAFCVWAKDIDKDGYSISAGEFVLSVGGYHPRFNKPEYYPTVPRFGLNWRVSDSISVKALCYFALTPVAVMAGLELSAVFVSKKLDAWFKLWADFLIQWSPFYYDVSLGIEIGVEYRTWIKTFRLDLSASIKIWGPEFSGKAKVKVCCFTKTISFGAGQSQLTPKISWFKFEKELLPKTQVTTKMLDGMISESTEGDVPVYVVNPNSCALNIESVVPFSEVSGITINSPAITNSKFNLYPVGKKADAKVIINISRTDGRDNDISPFDAEIKTKNLPAALWSNKYALGLNEEETTINKPVQFILKAKKAKYGIHFPVLKVPPFDDSSRYDMWNPENLGTLKELPKNKFGAFQEEFEETVEIKIDTKKLGNNAPKTENEKLTFFFGLRATPILVD